MAEASTAIPVSAQQLSENFSPEMAIREQWDGTCALLTGTLQRGTIFPAPHTAISATQERASGLILSMSWLSFCSATESTRQPRTSKSAHSVRCSITASHNAWVCPSGKQALHRHNRKRNQLQRLLTEDRVGSHATGERCCLHEKNRRINLYPVSGKKKI